MRRNDALRAVLRAAFTRSAALYHLDFERRIDGFGRAQARLRARYGVHPDTPIREYDDHTRRAVEAFAASRADVRLAYTSGSTSTPKALAYPRSRLRSFKADARSVGMRAARFANIREPSIFVFSSLVKDASFSALVVHQEGLPSRLAGLIEPARYLFTPALSSRVERYGATAVRLWLMALANPGLLYGTNPSTLAVFLAELYERWPESTAMIRAFTARDPAAYDDDTRRISERLASTTSAERLREIAAAESPLPMERIAPGLAAYCCWDGGYVRSFLRQIHAHLPPERYVHIPMYAMSTETIETLTWFSPTGEMRFLPLGPGVLYEFLPEGADDDPALLVEPQALVEGVVYSMVVSDPSGLLRYQTSDLFECRGSVRGVPDLRFLRRRGLAWSFTGEKLTGEQLSEVYARLERELPILGALAAQLTTLPSWPEGEALPRYHLLVGYPGRAPEGLDARALALAFDAALAEINGEYADKRRSGRLAPPSATVSPYARIAARLAKAEHEAGRGWESQFKLMPLTKKKLEELGEIG